MRVLVLGATGFVGRHLVAECHRRGDTVVGTVRPGEPTPAGNAVDRWVSLDLADDDSVDRAVAEVHPEGILHLAGQANVALANRAPRETYDINAGGTIRLLESVRRHAAAARVVVVTSAEVYGRVPAEELPVREERPLRPVTAYGVSKAVADFAAEEAAARHGLRIIRMRPFNHIGAGQSAGFVVPDFAGQIAAIERGEREPILSVGNLSARRDFTDVGDVARGYRDALERGTVGEAYNLCSSRSVPIRDLVDQLVDLSPVEITIRRDEARLRPVDVPEFLGTAEKAKRHFGWEPTVPLRESLRSALEEWRAAAAD